MAEEAAAREVPRGKWRPDGLLADRIHMCLQREGDLVLIPPGYSFVRAPVGWRGELKVERSGRACGTERAEQSLRNRARHFMSVHSTCVFVNFVLRVCLVCFGQVVPSNSADRTNDSIRLAVR